MSTTTVMDLDGGGGIADSSDGGSDGSGGEASKASGGDLDGGGGIADSYDRFLTLHKYRRNPMHYLVRKEGL